jgi:hypothetical protein
MFYEYSKLLSLYLTIPVTAASAERSFSVTIQRLNHIIIPHIHKEKLDLITWFEKDLFWFCFEKPKQKNFLWSWIILFLLTPVFYCLILSRIFLLFRYFLISFETIKRQIIITLLELKSGRKTYSAWHHKQIKKRLSTCSPRWLICKVEPTLDWNRSAAYGPTLLFSVVYFNYTTFI